MSRLDDVIGCPVDALVNFRGSHRKRPGKEVRPTLIRPSWFLLRSNFSIFNFHRGKLVPWSRCDASPGANRFGFDNGLSLFPTKAREGAWRRSTIC